MKSLNGVALSGTSEMVICPSPDLDPFDSCRPVDCHKKYSGNKNYFSHSKMICLPNPTCFADPTKEMPDVVSTSRTTTLGPAYLSTQNYQ